MSGEFITMAHGSGGRDSANLMRDVFSKYFSNPVLNRLDDAGIADIPGGASKIIVSTDSFVVTPLEFPGGDIGKLAVCGTVNDVSMMGADARYITCGFVLGTGLAIFKLERICDSMAKVADEAGVIIIAGDTKVIEGQGGSGSLIINTTGIGFPRSAGGGDVAVADADGCGGDDGGTSGAGDVPLTCAAGAEPGDVVIVSGNLGDHHACILSARMNIQNEIKSDCGLLSPIVDALYSAGVNVHVMRDVTRGGLATVLNEVAGSSGVSIELNEESIPVSGEVKAFCSIMGLDPIYMGNEGKMIALVSEADADAAITAMRGTEIGAEATIIGRVMSGRDSRLRENDTGVRGNDGDGVGVTMRTRVGGTRRIDMLYGEGLPRIC